MFTLIAAAGAAAAMYYFDPESGGRRRALLRDKFAWLKDEFGDVREAADGRMEHIGNVARGIAHESGIKRVPDNNTGSRPETGSALNASSMTGMHETHETHETHPENSQPNTRAA